MLTKEDIAQLIEVCATTRELAAKQDFLSLGNNLRADILALKNKIDVYQKRADIWLQEIIALRLQAEKRIKNA